MTAPLGRCYTCSPTPSQMMFSMNFDIRHAGQFIFVLTISRGPVVFLCQLPLRTAPGSVKGTPGGIFPSAHGERFQGPVHLDPPCSNLSCWALPCRLHLLPRSTLQVPFVLINFLACPPLMCPHGPRGAIFTPSMHQPEEAFCAPCLHQPERSLRRLVHASA